MSGLLALGAVVGVIGAVATWAFLTFPLGLQIWAAVVGLAVFFHAGGKDAGLKTAIIGTLFGAIVAWIALVVLTVLPVGAMLGVPLGAALVVLVSIIVMVMAASLPTFAAIPVTLYGFAGVVAYALLAGKLGPSLVSVSMVENPLLSVGVSMVAGAILAFAAEKTVGLVSK